MALNDRICDDYVKTFEYLSWEFILGLHYQRSLTIFHEVDELNFLRQQAL